MSQLRGITFFFSFFFSNKTYASIFYLAFVSVRFTTHLKIATAISAVLGVGRRNSRAYITFIGRGRGATFQRVYKRHHLEVILRPLKRDIHIFRARIRIRGIGLPGSRRGGPPFSVATFSPTFAKRCPTPPPSPRQSPRFPPHEKEKKKKKAEIDLRISDASRPIKRPWMPR